MVDLAQALLERGASPASSDRDGDTPCHLAITLGKAELVRRNQKPLFMYIYQA